jgi:arsenite methyltransferase
VAKVSGDKWAHWLRSRRDGGDVDIKGRQAPTLVALRDGVLDRAAVAEGDVVLDVGTGDGLIAFGALARGARVVFSDVSQDLLDVCRDRAGQFPDRCRFVRAAADDLSGVADASVDVVTTRSVLIYVERKPAAFAEFFRVLRPGGRLSVFEPINSFAALHGSYDLFGLDMAPVADLVVKVRDAYTDEPAMTGFDERHLLLCARTAGFTAIELDYHVEWDVPQPPPHDWEALLNTAPNPLAPTYAEAMAGTLTPAERETLHDHVRTLVAADTPARRTMASAYLSALRR